MIDICKKILSQPSNDTDLKNYTDYQWKYPVDFKNKYSYLLDIDATSSSSSTSTINNHVFAEVKTSQEPDMSMSLKFDKKFDDDIPFVSVVTLTYNRKNIFRNAIRNFQMSDYPDDKLEWIIVDDSPDKTQKLTDILPKDDRIKYHYLNTTGRLSIGQKRNYGVNASKGKIIVFMDDDDYYYPYSIYSRVMILLNNPQYQLVGVTRLDIYDIVDNFSARAKGNHISEASMGFWKSFWEIRRFPEEFCQQGEGHGFIQGREKYVITMPSCFNLIAITHNGNYTEDSRKASKFPEITSGNNLLSTIDLSARMWLEQLWSETEKK
jgi:hypothetical protein